MNDTTWQCTTCGNRYRSGIACPQCAVPGGIQQHGTHQNAVQIGANNSGPITQTTIAGNTSDEVSYQLIKQRSFASAEEITRRSKKMGIGGIAMIGLSFVTDVSTMMAYLFGPLPAALILLLMGLTGAMMVGSFIASMNRNRDLNNRWRTLDHGEVYERQDDGSIDLCTVHAKCPRKHCSGELEVRVPPPNVQGIKRNLGICNRHDLSHAYEFNLDTLKGSRIDVHPIPEAPPQRAGER